MKIISLSALLLVLSICLYSQEKITINDENSTVKGLKLGTSYAQKYSEVVERIKYYKKKRFQKHRTLGIIGESNDAGSCFFNFSKIDSFRNEINKKLKAINPGDSVSGFRFYYMSYKKNDKHAPHELVSSVKSTKKIHTLLIVATHCVKIDGNCIHTDIIDEDSKIAALSTSFVNEGTLCPPLPQSYCSGAIIANSIYK